MVQIEGYRGVFGVCLRPSRISRSSATIVEGSVEIHTGRKRAEKQLYKVNKSREWLSSSESTKRPKSKTRDRVSPSALSPTKSFSKCTDQRASVNSFHIVSLYKHKVNMTSVVRALCATAPLRCLSPTPNEPFLGIANKSRPLTDSARFPGKSSVILYSMDRLNELHGSK